MTRRDWAHLSDSQPWAMPARNPAWWEVVALVAAAGIILGAGAISLLTMIAAEPVATMILGG
jgi:hypothetical protein